MKIQKDLVEEMGGDPDQTFPAIIEAHEILVEKMGRSLREDGPHGHIAIDCGDLASILCMAEIGITEAITMVHGISKTYTDQKGSEDDGQ